MHGAGVVRELRQKRPAVEIFGVGGDCMKREGMEVICHISSLSFMGFVEVVKHLSLLRMVEQRLETMLLERRPDVLVLIDYPGFNLRFARVAKRYRIKVLYYISPQVWAWRKSRVKKMTSRIDTMKVVFPFEVGLYQKEGIDVEFVGHPLAESIGQTLTREELRARCGLDSARRILGLFPGSRRQEIQKIFPAMIEASHSLHESHGIQPVVGVAPNLGAAALQRHLPHGSPVVLYEGSAHDVMANADAAIVTSGTATLETGWFGTPMVIVYKTSVLSYLIGRMLIRVPHIGLVNIVSRRPVVPELVQYDMTSRNISRCVARLLDDSGYRKEMESALREIRRTLGDPGASSRVADGIVALAEAA
jgi:lipid-A-disaccharide synthase